MAFLYHKINRRLLVSLILVWSVVSFWFINPLDFARAIITILGLVGLCLTWLEISPIFLLIFLSFTSSYALYGYLSQYNLPIWLLMIAILIIFGYLFTFTEQKIGILGNKRLIYLALFSIVTLELFLILSYFLINPLGLSLIIAATCYVFVGFCYAVLAKRPEEKLSTYLWVAILALVVVLTSSTWSM